MSKLFKDQIRESSTYIQSQIPSYAKIAIILGSGLGELAKSVDSPHTISTQNIPHYPVSTVPGHFGNWISGTLAGTKVIIVQGRVHYYEGYSLQQVVYPIHLLASLGVRFLVITTASGGLNPDFNPGDLMIISDQINFAFNNPLIGNTKDFLGSRFPDMYDCYDPILQQLAIESGLELGIGLRRGVFCWVPGPSYETAAEVRMLRILGGDAVSMSTAPEVIAARQRHMRVLGIALITNLATGLSKTQLTHHDVITTAAKAEKKLQMLLMHLIPKIAQLS